MMSKGHRHGALGETMAQAYLEICGYRMLTSRYRIPGGEIDLIMARGRGLAFIEVKTRRRDGWAEPEDYVTPAQLGRMRTAARKWIHDHPGSWGWSTFDVVAISLDPEGGEARISHYMGAG